MLVVALWDFFDRGSPPRIAHAGGAYLGQKYTNSLEALDHNAKAFTYFELDFNFTADGHLVCAHNWHHISPKQPNISPTLAEFQALNDHEPFERCTLDSLAKWLTKNPGKKIVTDVKQKNIEALGIIANKWPELINRFTPQIYNPEEYTYVRDLGYEEIILTAYRYQGELSEFFELASSMELFAITVPKNLTNTAIDLLSRSHIPIYTHTVNRKGELLKYKCKGISEVYTDLLSKRAYNPSRRKCNNIKQTP